ncbi:hypothetical protein LOZ39_005042 [Ophidiomyces ophidiicola]|nr:hypothetical protein LOZ39_005042 [Ophidiomyces ophidiicola]
MSFPHPLHILRQRYYTALHQFTTGPKSFEILDTIAPQVASPPRTTTLHVLDSSFNPPTRAHLRIVKSALLSHRNSDSSAVRLLLLLATQNADKPSKPALFEDRLVMMNLFAQDLQDAIISNRCPPALAGEADAAAPTIDIGVTKEPYFIDKAAAISSSGMYPSDLGQVHHTGYDTLVRIFDPKYYPPKHTLDPLAPFLENHRLRVSLRPDDSWGDGDEQTKFLPDLAGGKMEKIGGRREWAKRIEVVEGRKNGEESVSSTKARQEAVNGNRKALGNLVTDRVMSWMAEKALYRN